MGAAIATALTRRRAAAWQAAQVAPAQRAAHDPISPAQALSSVFSSETRRIARGAQSQCAGGAFAVEKARENSSADGSLGMTP